MTGSDASMSLEGGLGKGGERDGGGGGVRGERWEGEGGVVKLAKLCNRLFILLQFP